MKLLRFVGYLLLAALAAMPIVFAVTMPQAHAADSSTTVDFSLSLSLVREYLMVGVDALLAIGIGWAVRFLHLTGSVEAGKLADQARALLHGAVENGIDRALATFGSSLSSVDVKNQVLASVIGYVQSNAASALDRLGASPDELRKLIEAKLGARDTASASDSAPLPFVRASP